jgi:1-acyl-sn-glycerol-3-phosphate acyltransferase/nucleoside-diphosphate-sugar epimerase
MTELLSVVGSLSSCDAQTAAAAVLVAPDGELRRELVSRNDIHWRCIKVAAPLDATSAPVADTLVYVPRLEHPPDMSPNLDDARTAFALARSAGLPRLVLVSSTLVYGASQNHPGLAKERRASIGSGQRLARVWAELESLAVSTFGERALTVLRAAPTPTPDGVDYFSRLLRGCNGLIVCGHDPTLQLLSVRDLGEAVARALYRQPAGIFNVVPAAPVALRAALGEAGCRPVPAPFVLHRTVRRLLARTGRAASMDQVQFIRFHLTASAEKSAGALGFVARDTSMSVARAVQSRRRTAGRACADRMSLDFDPFGLDPAYIRACSRGLMGFLHRRYWRIETDGLDRIPEQGAAVLVGMHRGFMPFDGVMTLLTVAEQKRRIPRFLIHPGLLKFPFLFNLMSKLGGVVACEENADHVLGSGELLGVYPEGIRGAFTMYSRAHRIAPSWRNDCIVFALRHRAPIVPFVTVGSAEIFPILARIHAGWWKKYSEWPFIPITPTFPLVPLPLPSKWHTLFLDPVHVERDHPPTAAGDPRVVRAIAVDLKDRMERALADLRSRRRSIFFGSLFKRPEADAQSVS